MRIFRISERNLRIFAAQGWRKDPKKRAAGAAPNGNFVNQTEWNSCFIYSYVTLFSSAVYHFARLRRRANLRIFRCIAWLSFPLFSSIFAILFDERNRSIWISSKLSQSFHRASINHCGNGVLNQHCRIVGRIALRINVFRAEFHKLFVSSHSTRHDTLILQQIFWTKVIKNQIREHHSDAGLWMYQWRRRRPEK